MRTQDGDLARLAHHDGSALYVPPGPYTLGQVVPVRVRVPDDTVTAVHVRVVRDGEPRIEPARPSSADAEARWFTADVLVHNPVTSYRFLLARPGGYRWLNARGVFDRDVPDGADFRLTAHPQAPAWLRDAVVYQIFPDRFARSASADARALPEWAIPMDWDAEPLADGPGVGRQVFGGDLRGIVEHLDHLQDLGVTTVYLTPVFPGRSNHRYDASTFEHVDPLLGGDEALAELSAAVHARGMRLMGDVTTNHTGAGHEWFRTARSDPSSEEASFYLWTDAEPGYVGWLGHASLPKLDYDSPQVLARMAEGPDSVIGRWLQTPYGLDGWRVDVANMTGRHGRQDRTLEVARTIRRTMDELKPDAALVSEHFHDAAADLPGDGWQGNMNYSAFTRPLWTWLADPDSGLGFLGLPVPVPRRSGAAMVETMRDFDSQIAWPTLLNQWNMLDSHDTARIRTVVGDPRLVEVAAGLLFTYLGVPVVFAGDELGLEGRTGEHARVPMPWDRPERRDEHVHETYRRLAALRHQHEALRSGSLRWVLAGDDAVGYVRETPDEALLVVLARAPWAGTSLPLHLANGPGAPRTVYGTAPLAVSDEGLEVPGAGPAVGVWRLR